MCQLGEALFALALKVIDSTRRLNSLAQRGTHIEGAHGSLLLMVVRCVCVCEVTIVLACGCAPSCVDGTDLSRRCLWFRRHG